MLEDEPWLESIRAGAGGAIALRRIACSRGSLRMNVFLISEDESIAGSIRQVLMREGVDCPISSQITFGQATRRLSTVTADLIVAVLPDDPLQSVEALDVLATVARSDRTLVIAVGPAADAKL